MPIDDHRSRTPARPVADEADDELEVRHPPGEPNPFSEIEAAQIAEVLHSLAEYRANPGLAVPWEDVEEEMFGPPTPEELAEDGADEPSLRARR